ncbi:MAG: Mrp/NBP35 family ATP-binding protein [Candidatus Micrarchaeia archaeon]
MENKIMVNEGLKIKRKIAILSGKGGVGKSTISLLLTLALAKRNKSVGILDADISGASIPKMLNLKGKKPKVSEGKILPINTKYGIKVISIDFFLESKEAIIWRGPLKAKAINQFLTQVEWGNLDYLVVDLPPGTGDEALSIASTIKVDGAIIVTIPSEVSKYIVKKAAYFCKELKIPIIGIVENMSGIVCPKCGNFIEAFPGNAGEEIAKELRIKFLGKIPIDPKLSKGLDKGNLEEVENSKIMQKIVELSHTIEK